MVIGIDDALDDVEADDKQTKDGPDEEVVEEKQEEGKAIADNADGERSRPAKMEMGDDLMVIEDGGDKCARWWPDGINTAAPLLATGARSI